MVAALYALLSLLVVVLAVFYLKRHQITKSGTIAIILAVPVLIWAINSEAVSKISAGGVTVEFREAATSRVAAEKLADITLNSEAMEKGSLSDLAGKIRNIKPGKPLSLVIDIGKTNYYKADIILPYLQALSILDPDASMVVVDQQKFVASAPATIVIAFLDPPNELNPDDASLKMRSDNQARMQAAIASGDRKKWLDLPGFTDASISSAQNNLDALQLMDSAGLKSVIIVDADEHPVGIVQRDAIVAHLVRKLASDV